MSLTGAVFEAIEAIAKAIITVGFNIYEWFDREPSATKDALAETGRWVTFILIGKVVAWLMVGSTAVALYGKW